MDPWNCWFVSSFFFSNYKTKFIRKVTEVVEMSKMVCVGSGNRLKKQKLNPWSLGKRGEVTQEEEEGEGKDTSMLPGDKVCRQVHFLKDLSNTTYLINF